MATLTIGDIGVEVDLNMRQGATFGPYELDITAADGSPLNLTDCIVRGKMRKTYKTVDVTAEFICTIDIANSRAYFSLTDEITAAIDAGEALDDPEGSYVYDLELEYADGTVRPLIYGIVQVMPEATYG